jgi:hypothetical protein
MTLEMVMDYFPLTLAAGYNDPQFLDQQTAKI